MTMTDREARREIKGEIKLLRKRYQELMEYQTTLDDWGDYLNARIKRLESDLWKRNA